VRLKRRSGDMNLTLLAWPHASFSCGRRMELIVNTMAGSNSHGIKVSSDLISYNFQRYVTADKFNIEISPKRIFSRAISIA